MNPAHSMNKKSSMMFLKDLFIIADLEKRIVARCKALSVFFYLSTSRLATDDHSNVVVFLLLTVMMVFCTRRNNARCKMQDKEQKVKQHNR